MTGLVLWVALAQTAGAAVSPVSADAVVAAALSRSPEAAAARAGMGAAQGMQKAECGLRSDPTLRASGAVVGDAWSVSASQPLSVSGEGRAACRSAGHGLASAQARLRRVQIEVAATARLAWVDAVAAASQLTLAEQALDVSVGIEAAVRQRTEVGEAPVLDLRLARLQVERARTTWMAAVVDRGSRLAALSAVSGLDVEALELPEDPLEGSALPTQAPPEVRSDVQSARAAAQAARAAVSRERSATLPPVSLGVFVEEEGTELRAGPTVSVVLPVWRGNTDGRAAARAELDAAEAVAAARERRAGAEQAGAAQVGAMLEAALVDQPVDLPLEARAALASVALGYDRGELDLITTSLLQAEILDGHRAWLEGRRLVAAARIERMRAMEDAALLGGAGQ